MIKVVNKYKETNYYYIGRGSMLGNPFVMNNKDEIIVAIEDYQSGKMGRLIE